jgi:predicted Zn-dependent protease
MKLIAVCFAASFAAGLALAQDKPKNSDLENIGKRDINRGNLNTISLEKEIAMGRQLAAEYERQVKLAFDADVNEYVNRVGQNIVRNSDAALPVTFKIVESPDVNGMAFPGGYTYINTGTILAAENEAELAWVLAQQVAHVAARHGTETASKAELVNFANMPLIFTGGVGGFALRQAAGSLIPMQFLQMARIQVMEADYLGLQYLFKAGYDPAAATTFLTKIQLLEQANPSPTSRLFSAQPPAADRIAAVQKNIGLILPARSQNALTTPEFDRIKELLRR